MEINNIGKSISHTKEEFVKIVTPRKVAPLIQTRSYFSKNKQRSKIS